MIMAKRWKKSKDPSAKVILALATQVSNLEQKLQVHSTDASSSNKPKLHIPMWRTENKGEKCGRDGKTWYWCPHHKKEGLFDGLYMPHKPEDHDAWAKNKKEAREKRKASKSDEPSSTTKLQLTESMRQALVTQGNMTVEQANALWTK